MNWDAIGAVGEILGAIAVIATLVYLARQIRHSVSLARAEQNQSVMELYTGWNDLIVSNPDVAAILGREPDTELSQGELVQIRHLAYRIVDVYMTIEFCYSNDQLSEEEFAVYKDDIIAVSGFYPVLLSAMREIVARYPTTLQAFEIFKSLRST